MQASDHRSGSALTRLDSPSQATDFISAREAAHRKPALTDSSLRRRLDLMDDLVVVNLQKRPCFG